MAVQIFWGYMIKDFCENFVSTMFGWVNIMYILYNFLKVKNCKYEFQKYL